MKHHQSTITSPRDLGAFIHDVRLQNNLTQEELSTKAGVSRSWLIGVEQGKRQRAELDKILSVFQVLNIDLVLEHHTQLPESEQNQIHQQNINAPELPDNLSEIISKEIPHFGQPTRISQAISHAQNTSIKP